jgi:type I restriction enzyme S subunit
MSGWSPTTLGAISNKIGSGATPTGGSNTYKLSGVPFIRSQNVLDFSFSADGIAYLDDNQAHELRSVTVEENDVLLNITGDSVARCCIAPKAFIPARVNQHVAIIRLKQNKANHLFVFYLLQLMKDELLMQSEIGATRKALTKGMLENLEIVIPLLPEQKTIAAVLSSLDDKIDLLHRQNQTLEAMATTLFRQWFVEEAQEDWEERTLDDVISVKGGTTPSTKEPEYWDGDIHWTSPRDLSNHNSVFIFDTERKITKMGLSQIGSGLLPIGTVLLSSRAPIGYLAITDMPVAINQGYIAIICDKSVSNYFMYLWCKANMEVIENAGNGSVFQEISKSNFKTLGFVLPPKEKLKEFDEGVAPIFKKTRTNQLQIRTLETLRDSLLPKLMSGEVRVEFDPAQ